MNPKCPAQECLWQSLINNLNLNIYQKSVIFIIAMLIACEWNVNNIYFQKLKIFIKFSDSSDLQSQELQKKPKASVSLTLEFSIKQKNLRKIKKNQKHKEKPKA